MDVVVFDNSATAPERCGDYRYDCFRIHYISDVCNPGVSKAYNTGLKVAKKLKKKWLLFLDHDTNFPRYALERYAQALAAYPDIVLFVPILTSVGRIYSPCRYVLNAGFPLAKIKPGVCSTRGKSVLNSGMCISIEAFDRVGGFNESIPLDFADHDFMKRYGKHFDSFCIVDVTCSHGFSGMERIDRDAALTRFGYYCKGARASINNAADAGSLCVLVSLRAARLTFRYRTTAFLRLFLRTFLQN